MNNNKKKVLYWISGVVLSPIILVCLLAVAIYFPPIQNFVVRKVALYASEKTDMDIRVDHVHLVFPLKLGLEGVHVIQQNDSLPQVHDTVADIKSTIADVQLIPLFSKQINIDRLEFNKMKLNTTNFIHEARVKGTIGMLELKSHGIDLSGEIVRINKCNLKDANLDVSLSDTVPPDTTPSHNFWKIYADNLNIENTDAVIHTPGDTLRIETYMGKTMATGGYFDLYKGLYNVRKFDWQGGKLTYDNIYKGYTKGLDYNHLALSNITIGIDSLYYYDPKLSFNLRACAFKEKSGIEVSRLQGPMQMDSTCLRLPNLIFSTPNSNLKANVYLDFNAFADKNPGIFNTVIHGFFGKQDLMYLMGDMPLDFRKRWPNYPVAVDGVLKGNLKRVNFAGLKVKLPTAFDIKANGFFADMMDVKHLQGDIILKAKTYNLNFLTCMLDKKVMQTVNIPHGIGLDGNLKIRGGDYSAKFLMREGGGRVNGEASVNLNRMAYMAKVNATSFKIQHFLPKMGLRSFSGYLHAKGVGTDFMSRHTALYAKAKVKSFGMSGYDFSNINLDANIVNGKVHADIDSKNRLLKGLINFDALIRTKRIAATVGCDISHIDLFNLHIADRPIIAALCGQVDMESDMKDFYKIEGRVGDIAILDSSKLYRPQDEILLDVFTKRDTTHAIINNGDFSLNLDANGGYKKLMNIGDRFMTELNKQIRGKYIDQSRLRRTLPIAHIALNTGSENFICRALKKMGYKIGNANMNLTSSPKTGLNGWMEAVNLNVDSIQLDTLRLNLISDENTMRYSGQIRNNKKNPQYVFNALFDGGIHEHGTYLNGKIYDAKDRLGLSSGITATMESNGIRVTLADNDPILGYKRFHVNSDNYAFLGDDKRVSANIKLTADDGTGVQVYTTDSTEALQDVTIGLHKFDLEKIMSVIPYTPDVSGIMDGDFHVIQTKDNITVSSAINIDNLIYEGSKMGNVGSEFVYMPKSDGSHHVDGYLTVNSRDVASIVGTYNSKGQGYLDATLKMDRTPLSLINGFIPDKIIGLKGYGEGELSVKGTLSKPQVNGEIYMDSSYLVSEPYGVEMRFDDDPVRIIGSHLLFENFEMYAHNEQPLDVSGYLDFSDLNKMMLDMRMRAHNFQLIDAKENRRSETFGKCFVNFMAAMKGPLDNLNMRGKLDVLGSTDMTYIMRDTPLSTDNQLDGLVDFVDFGDTISDDVAKPPLSGFNMDISMNIDQGAHIVAQLNADKTNYIDLQGGGDLRLLYSLDEMRLTGRYTLSEGEMKYSLPVIPLKTFTIKDGSYVEFTGEPMNPRLNVTATEQTKASVGSENTSRQVQFDCGVEITKTLSDMGLKFIIDAPEDLTVHSELQSMTDEERGKVAVTMLTTGMYIANGNTSSFTMNSALSAFLNGQINKISGNAMKTLDLSFGVDNSTNSTGGIETDYSFKFAKRFWNNRLRIVVGGKVSTGADVSNNNESFFDNVTFEYRINQNSNKYLRLFYDRDSYDYLEGNVGEFGAGFLWRRKLQHFKDIFNFKGTVNVMPREPRDTIIKK